MQGVKPGLVNDMVILSARPKERRLVDGIRSNLYKGVSSALPELSTLRVDEVYGDLPSNVAPLITTMAITNNVPLVDSKFGKVQQGSVLSYHLPTKMVPNTRPHSDAPSPPQLPLSNYCLGPSTCSFVYSEHQQLHMMSMATSFETAHKVENSTKKQSSCAEWHQLRRLRITSTKFREGCHTRGETSAENLAKRLLRPSHQTADTRRGLDMEPAAVEEYCRAREVNHYPCGLLIHPDAAWMGSSPNGIVYDPKEQPEFRLVEIKCPNVLSYVDCPYIKISEGTHTLRKSHAYFWQIQGQLLISGLEWCDFVVYTQEDMFIQRISRDKDITATIKEKIDHFFFIFISTLPCSRELACTLPYST
uniref:YqaJ viral recombinase domain-containing protein n=1 Tax=Sparus aurata TaxID=8175 RepID=A0A671V656_SPAAU